MSREQIIADYLNGMKAEEVAAKYGRSINGLRVSLSRWGVKLPTDERSRRCLWTNQEKRLR